jgi:hypothetical protein
MEVLMEVSRVGAEAEVGTMAADTAATETAQTTAADEMGIITEAVAALAHVLGAQIETRGGHEETAVIVMIRMAS